MGAVTSTLDPIGVERIAADVEDWTNVFRLRRRSDRPQSRDGELGLQTSRPLAGDSIAVRFDAVAP